MDSATKHEIAKTLRGEIAELSALVLVEFSGLTVADANELRGKFREQGCVYRVHKNSTIRFAIADTKHEPMTPMLKGVTGLAYNPEDPGAPARVARDFLKDHEEHFTIKGGILDGETLDPAGVRQLADLPGPRELKAQLLALLNTPATNMLRVMNAVPQSMLYVLNAKQDAA